MRKERQYSKYIFLILVLLSISSMWSIYSKSDISNTEKIFLTCINFSYLFFVAEFIEIFIYRNILRNVFEYKNYFPSSMYNFFNIIMPIISILIYVLAWTLYLTDPISYVQTSGILIFMSGGCIQFSVFGKQNIVFANKDEIAVGFRLISYNSISSYDLNTEDRMGRNINKITAHLDGGTKITFTVDSKYVDELVKNLSK